MYERFETALNETLRRFQTFLYNCAKKNSLELFNIIFDAPFCEIKIRILPFVSAEDFLLRWGTHYVKSGKFGGRLQIFKTMEASQVSSKQEFSREMEASYSSLFSSLHVRKSEKQGSSQKQQNKEMSTSVSVEGGDQKIASIITDFNSPTIKSNLDQWLESIRTFPKAFSFMVAPITDLVKFNPSSLFPDENRDWGCEAHTADMKEDPETKEKYYEIRVNGTLTKKSCPYKGRDNLVYLIERRRNSLERAIAVYMEEVNNLLIYGI